MGKTTTKKKSGATPRPKWTESFFKIWNSYPPKDVPFWLAHYAGMLGDVSLNPKIRNSLLANWDELLERFREERKENPHYDVSDFLYEEHEVDIEKDLDWFFLNIEEDEEMVCAFLGRGTCFVLDPGAWDVHFSEFPQVVDDDDEVEIEEDEGFDLNFGSHRLSKEDREHWREFIQRTDDYDSKHKKDKEDRKDKMASNTSTGTTLSPELQTFATFARSQMTTKVQEAMDAFLVELFKGTSPSSTPSAYWARVKEAFDTAATALKARSDADHWTITIGFDDGGEKPSSTSSWKQGLFVEVAHKVQSLRERRTLKPYQTVETATKDGQLVSTISRSYAYSSSTSSSYSGGYTYYGSTSYGKSKKFTYSDVEALRKKPYVPDPAKVQRMPKKLFRNTIIVGDLHGCADELLKLLDLAKFDPSKDRLISVGDIVDRGPKIHECFEIFREYKGFASLGNHEEPFLKWRMYEKQDEWAGVHNPIDLTKRDDQKGTMKALTEEDWAWMETMPLFFRLPEFKNNPLVVHAGLFPGRFVRPEDMDPFGIIRMIRIDPKKSETLPFSATTGVDWWDEYDKRPGPHHVIYGHSTTKEVRRMKYSTGLDTGGVYGGKLSALMLPSWEVISVDCTAHHVSSAAELSGAQSFIIGGPEKKASSSSAQSVTTTNTPPGGAPTGGSTDTKGFLPRPKDEMSLISKVKDSANGSSSSGWYELDTPRKDAYDIDGVFLEAFTHNPAQHKLN